MARGGPNRPAPPAAAPASPDVRYEDRYQAASRYYVQGETMESIAKQLMLSRSTVSRLLREARDQGLVRITLADHAGSTSSPALALADAFGVRVHLVAVRASATETARLDQVAKMAGGLLTEAVGDHDVIGVAWGATVSRVVQHVSRRPLTGATAVQLNGGANPRGFGLSYTGEILRALADAFDADLALFPLPAFFDQPAARDVMWQERSVQQVLDLRARADIAVFGVGSLQARTRCEVYSAGYLDDADVARLALGRRGGRRLHGPAARERDVGRHPVQPAGDRPHPCGAASHPAADLRGRGRRPRGRGRRRPACGCRHRPGDRLRDRTRRPRPDRHPHTLSSLRRAPL